MLADAGLLQGGVEVCVIGVAGDDESQAAVAEGRQNLGHLLVERSLGEELEDVVGGATGIDALHLGLPEGVLEMLRPGLGEGEEGRLGPREGLVGVAAVLLGVLAGVLQPGLPDGLAVRVMDVLRAQEIVDGGGEGALVEVQQGAVAVEGDDADVPAARVRG